MLSDYCVWFELQEPWKVTDFSEATSKICDEITQLVTAILPIVTYQNLIV